MYKAKTWYGESIYVLLTEDNIVGGWGWASWHGWGPRVVGFLVLAQTKKDHKHIRKVATNYSTITQRSSTCD